MTPKVTLDNVPAREAGGSAVDTKQANTYKDLKYFGQLRLVVIFLFTYVMYVIIFITKLVTVIYFLNEEDLTYNLWFTINC